MARTVLNLTPLLSFGLLFAPAVLSLITLFATQGEDYGIMSGLVLLCGSALSGLVCGISFAWTKKDARPLVRWACGIGMAIGSGFLAFAIGVGGCSLVVQTNLF
ncbi:MAG: hypothetical protein ABGZ37_10970 [Akkermansiaceae bacterium]